jgi:hypothetical protein
LKLNDLRRGVDKEDEQYGFQQKSALDSLQHTTSMRTSVEAAPPTVK